VHATAKVAGADEHCAAARLAAHSKIKTA
jgi:hypothetical protein